METFEYGTRVEHPTYGRGKALNSYPANPLVQVDFDNDTGMDKRLGRLVHPDSLTKVPVQYFDVFVTFTPDQLGCRSSSRFNLTKDQLKAYLASLDPDTVDEYSVKRYKGNDPKEGK